MLFLDAHNVGVSRTEKKSHLCTPSLIGVDAVALRAVCRPAVCHAWPDASCGPRALRTGPGSYLTVCPGPGTHRELGNHCARQVKNHCSVRNRLVVWGEGWRRSVSFCLLWNKAALGVTSSRAERHVVMLSSQLTSVDSRHARGTLLWDRGSSRQPSALPWRLSSLTAEKRLDIAEEKMC